MVNNAGSNSKSIVNNVGVFDDAAVINNELRE